MYTSRNNLMATSKKNIIIAGAGFGGITAALTLAKTIKRYEKAYEIILVDRHRHQLYTPALYEIAAIPEETAPDALLKSSILIPISDIIGGGPIKFICDEVTGLKPESQKLILKSTWELEYEFLILALGSKTNYFDIPGLKENSFPLKTYDDAKKLRNAIEDSIKKTGAVKIAVGGGGVSGVELIAEFVNFICTIREKILKTKNVCSAEFVLIEAAQEILRGFEPWVADKTRNRLTKLGIQIKTGSAISSVVPGTVTLKNGTTVSYDILIWTGGVKGPEVLKNFGLPVSDKNSVMVDEFLHPVRSQAPSAPADAPMAHRTSNGVHAKTGNERIFAIGDNSTFINPQSGKPLIWSIPVAESEGVLVAKNILRAIDGRKPKKFTPLKKYPYIFTVGSRYAIADLIFIKFSGLLGLMAKALVELRYLLFILPPKKALITWFRAVKYYSSNN